MSNHTSWEITHLKKKNFFWKFFWGFLSIFYVVLAQIQKNQYVLKTSKSFLFETIDIYLIGLFFLILLQFLEKKHDQKKIFFQKFFFRLLKITFSEHNSARFDKKNFYLNKLHYLVPEFKKSWYVSFYSHLIFT